MEELQKLYDVLVREGKYSKSFDEFQSKWSKDQAYKDKVYGVVTRDGLYSKDKDSFLRKYTASQPIVKKKDSSESNIPQPQKTSTTVSPSADGSLATQKPTNVSVPVGGGYSPLAIPAFFSEATKTVYQFADDALVSARKSLQEEGFFDDDIPDTDTPISDAVKKKIVSIDPKYSKPQNDGVLNPAPYIKSAADLGLKIINSTLPQDKKNVIIAALNLGDATLKRNLKDIEKIQDYALPKDNIAVNVGKGMVGMAPDLLLARAMGTPVAAEGRFTKFATEVTKDAKPLLQKYVPKAAKFIEQSIRAPFTKIMGTKGVASGVANTKEGEDIVEAGFEGGLEGTAEGMYMEALGVTSGKVMPAIAKQISKTGLNSAWSTGIANPLANAGVFATAKAIRTPIETGELATEEELLTELGTGIGFSLLHAGSLAKNQNELNHYADNVLKTDATESIKRVANETKDNLDLVYNPDLTPENISKLETARNELKSAIIKEPDLRNKQLLINEALKIQNQLDAHSAINNIVENKDILIEEVNSNESIDENQKEFYTKKIAAIADYFDTSEFGLKKKELNTRIDEAQKKLDDASLGFTNLNKPSDRVQAKIEIEKRRAELEGLNEELTNLIIDKDAIQEQSTTEIPVQSETGVSQTVEEGISEPKPEVVTEQVTQEEVTPTKEVVKVKKSDDFMNDAEHVVTLNGKEVGRIYYDRSSKAWKDPYFDKSKFLPESFERVYGDILGETKQESIDKLVERYKESLPKEEIPIEETIVEKTEEPKGVQFTKDNVLNEFLNKLNSLNPVQINPINNKSFIYGDKASLEFNRFDKGDKNEISLEGISSLEKGKGLGKEAMIDIIKSADELGTTLTLDAKPFGKEGLGKKELIDFYKKNGFEVDKQYLEDLDFVSENEAIDYVLENESEALPMIREPKKIEVVVETKPTQTVDQAIKTLQESKEYAEADDIQKENLVRATRKKFGLKEKAAPSVNRLFGKLKDITKVTMTEKAGLVKQIKDTAKGARESIQEWKKQTQELTDELSELEKSGKITLSQQTAIINKFSKVNIFSEKSVSRFTDYMTKVFADANYKEKLNTARKNLSSIKRLSKNEEKNGDLRALGTEFAKIDPSIVENIDKYNDLSSKIKDAIDGSKIRKANVKFAETVDIEKATEYIEKTLEEQEVKLREEKIAELQDLIGVDAKEFSAEEIDALLESDKDLSKDDIKIVRATIEKGFKVYSSIVKEMVRTGEDPFTGEEVSFDKKQKDIIERFMDIDPNKIEDPKEALRTVDSLINFIQNKSTAGMLRPIAEYEAIKGGDEAITKGLKAIRIRKYFSEKLGRALGQKTTTLPVLGEKMFKGVNRSLEFEDLVGISDLINNSSKAESETNVIAKDYIKEFYQRKANGEAYNSAYNDIERGVLAHITRNVIGLESRRKKVFDKRKQEVLDTAELLSSKGNESEQEIAKLIKKAYDKVLDGSENIKDAKSKADINNAEGVDYWVNQWSKRYEELADLSLNFYNKVLGKDLGYTPDKVIKLQDKREDVDLEDTKSQFFANTDEILYDKKSGTLMDKQEDRTIPKDMYIDFSFDKKNGNAISDALTDLYTAFDISKVGAFLKSDNFKKIIPSSKDANLYDKRIKKFVKITRRKTPFQNDEVSDLIKRADRLAKLGVTMSLASGRQPFIQSIPVMVSTAINAGGVNPIIGFEPKYNKWLQDLGYAVSNRGVESQGQLESMNKLLEKAAEMPREKALKFIEKIQDKSLKLLLVEGDVAVAKAAFKAYYEQSLKQQGKEYKNIDYSDHEPNKKAANYAQRMVDRQQNISNSALAGDLFTNESSASKIFIKMLMPFSSFRMNQSARLGSDLTTLEYWNTSTKEDKIIALKSIAGYTAEAATYRALQIGAALLFNSIASSIMGKDNEKEDKKTKENLYKGAAQGAFVDTFSPIPLADPFTQDALAYSAEELQDIMDIPEKDKVKLFESKEQSALKMLGTYGIPITKAKEIYDLGKLAYTREYKDKYGNKKKISEKDAENLKVFIGPLIGVTVVGAFSPDVSAITRKAIKSSQTKKTGISKEELKKKNPEAYKRIYGDN
jgi:hypothetical protein